MSQRQNALILGLLAIGLGLSGRAVAADETYDLRGPAPKKGQVFLESSTMTMKEINGKLSTASEREKEVEVLGVEGREVVKIRTRVIKDVTRISSVGGEKKTEKNSLVGEIVFSELANKKWKHVLEDTKPDEDQKKELKNFDDPENDDELYPAEKVKVGHAWKIEASALKRVLGSKYTDVTGAAKSKFIRVEKIGDDPCAVIEMEMDLKGKSKDDEDNDVVSEIKGKMLYYRSIALAVDVKFSLEGTATYSTKVEMNGQKSEINITGKMTSEGTTTIKKR